MEENIFPDNLFIDNGQLGKVIQTSLSVNTAAWSIGRASTYIITLTANIDFTLPSISANLDDKTTAYIGHQLTIYNRSSGFLLTIKDSGGTIVALSPFDGTLDDDEYITLIASDGGANDWIIIQRIDTPTTLQDLYDNSTTPAIVNKTNAKAFRILGEAVTGANDVRISNSTNTDVYLLAIGTAINSSSLVLLGGTTATTSRVLVIGNTDILTSPASGSQAILGHDNLVEGNGHVLGNDNIWGSYRFEIVILGGNNTINANRRIIIGSDNVIGTGNNTHVHIGRLLTYNANTDNVLTIQNTSGGVTMAAANITNSRIYMFTDHATTINGGSVPPGTADHDPNTTFMQRKVTTTNALAELWSMPATTDSIATIEATISARQINGTGTGANWTTMIKCHFEDIGGTKASAVITGITHSTSPKPFSVSLSTSATHFIINVSSSGNADGDVKWYGSLCIDEVQY